jgi:hypothetical protein
MKLRRTFIMAGLGQLLGMATSITQSSYSIFIRLADFVAFVESGLPFALVFAAVGLVTDFTNRNRSRTD